MALRLKLGAFALVALLVACSDDETTNASGPTTTTTASTGGASSSSSSTTGPGGSAGSSSSAGGMGMGPGTITITAQNLNGQDGNRLIATVLTEGTTTSLGGICKTINGGSASGVAGVVDMMDICLIGNPVTFDADTYDIAAGIYPPAGMAPLQCLKTKVTVAGNTQITLPAFMACQ